MECARCAINLDGAKERQDYLTINDKVICGFCVEETHYPKSDNLKEELDEDIL